MSDDDDAAIPEPELEPDIFERLYPGKHYISTSAAGQLKSAELAKIGIDGTVEDWRRAFRQGNPGNTRLDKHVATHGIPGKISILDGVFYDGHHRYAAAVKHGISRLRTESPVDERGHLLQAAKAPLGLMAHFAARRPGPFYHGTKAELEPGDLIEPNKYPPTMPDPDIRGPDAEKPREHTYFSARRNYVIEHYGPNVYQVEPTGDYTRDPEYTSSRAMYRSRHPLRVVRQVSREWGLPHEHAARRPPAGLPALESPDPVSYGFPAGPASTPRKGNRAASSGNQTASNRRAAPRP